MDTDKRIFAGEAFTVPLDVVMEVAVALLGEAEALTVVVACEERPHHYGKPGRLAQGSPVRCCHRPALRCTCSPCSSVSPRSSCQQHVLNQHCLLQRSLDQLC